MAFSNQFKAKKFFVDKVIDQARKDNVPLSEAEKYMLNWTEVEDGFHIDDKLSEKFYEETTDEQYEIKIRTLLKNAYKRDIRLNSEMKEVYRSAYRAMKKNDHYILIMIREAFGSKLKKWGLF